MVHSDNRMTATIAMGVFATGVAASVLLIAAHDRPFMGELSVGPTPLLQVMPEASSRCRPAPGRHWNGRSRNFSDQSIGEDECHVVYLLHRKIFDGPLHLRDVDAPSLDDTCVRYSNRSGEENQRQAEHDQDS